MTTQYRLLDDWLASEEWRQLPQTALEIPETVLTSLQSFLAADHVDQKTLDRCEATLSTLFRSYRQSGYAHKDLLGEALVKLGTQSQRQFWQPAIAFLNMAPGLGQEAIRRWVEVLQLSADRERELRTELFHAMR